MASKKVFMLRVDPEVYDALEKWAADEFRSVNGQIEWILDTALKSRRRSPGKKVTPPGDVPDKNTAK